MSKPNRRGRKPNRIKLANVYHGTYHDIEGDLRPSVNPDRSLYGPCVYATSKAGSAKYGSNRIKMQINPKQLETVEKGPYEKQQDTSKKLRDQNKNLRIRRFASGKNNYYVLDPALANKGRVKESPAITGSKARTLRNLLRLARPSGRRISTPGGNFPIP